jgi:putative flippase GtrA
MNQIRFLIKIFFKLPEKVRFIIIGGFNTIFGFSLFAILYFLLGTKIHYLIILVFNHLIAVSISYLMLKFFVFCTKGNYLREFINCHITYLLIITLNMFFLYAMVDVFKQNILFSQLFITFFLVIFSYYGNKYFSFTIERT